MTTPIFNILTCVLRGKPYVLPSGGDYRVEVTYVKDLIRGMRRILEAEHVKYPAYNMSSGKALPISEYGAMIKKLLPDAQIEIGPGLLDGVKLRAAMDTRRAKDEFGYEHSPMEACIVDFIEYLRSTIGTQWGKAA
jgi:nucleoside-diphosphate-sugar epimerase